MKRIAMSLVVLFSMAFATTAALAGGSQGERWHKGVKMGQ